VEGLQLPLLHPHLAQTRKETRLVDIINPAHPNDIPKSTNKLSVSSTELLPIRVSSSSPFLLLPSPPLPSLSSRDHAPPPKDLDEQVEKVKKIQREKPVSDQMKRESSGSLSARA